jgi:2-polyprenyl-6-methoxyphenol hydroxylase-like FAD-dependent oxidoreductase
VVDPLIAGAATQSGANVRPERIGRGGIDVCGYEWIFLAHRLADALRDAELLAAAVVQWGGDERQRSRVLADYQSTRDRLALPLLQTVDRIASNDWDDSEISELLVQLSAEMARSVDAITSSSLDQQLVR